MSADKIGMPDTCINCGKTHEPGECEAEHSFAASAGSATGRIKTDRRPPMGGWANGNYWCKCCECGETFVGDKRAVVCADCAYAKPPNAELSDGTPKI